jgi:hypothetical protein
MTEQIRHRLNGAINRVRQDQGTRRLAEQLVDEYRSEMAAGQITVFSGFTLG